MRGLWIASSGKEHGGFENIAMKRLLVIAYAFPPCGGAGVQRTAKFVRYLPEFGWQPTVLTVDPSCYGVKDSSHADELPPEVEIIRTANFDPLVSFGKASNGHSANGDATAQSSHPSHIKRLARDIGKGAWMALYNNVLIPDQHVLWYPRAVRAGLDAHRRHTFDLIYATGEPYSAYIAASRIARRTGVPYVIDMRDPWTLSPYRNNLGSRARQFVEQWQEQQVLDQCGACVFANRSIYLYSEAYPHWKERFEYIPNGYDSADFEGVEPKQFEKFTIVHTGTFLPGYRTADTFLRALREALNARPEIRQILQVLFVGKVGAERDLIRELSLNDIVIQTGYLPHRESIAYLKGAHLLLLVGGEHRWEETGKIYEYFAVQKPILALVNPEGTAADLLRRYQSARIIDRSSINDAAKALAEIVDCNQSIAAEPDPAWTSAFERRNLTAQLARVFERCLSAPVHIQS
jgi:glycosyltransferase involved in cell wall biosynthesis